MKALEKAEGRGSNPYYAGNFDGESDELRDLRLSLVAERDALKVELEAECEETKRWLVKAQNERDARKELEAELEAMKIAASPAKWWKCSTHGPAKAGAWGCPECVSEMRAELERIKSNPITQFRKPYCADWFDGYPDPTDGGGPYETRTLYALGRKHD